MKRRLFSQAMLYAIKGVDGGKEKGALLRNFVAATQ